MKTYFFLSLFVFSLFGGPSIATAESKPLKVITTITELAWVANEVGGDLVNAEPLLQGTENPHFIDAVPSFIQKTAEADVVFIIGLDLEIGWMPKVLARSGNAKVQPGGIGYTEVGNSIEVLGKPVGNVDRSMGDVHPGGNPHFWLSPSALSQVSTIILETLITNSPKNAEAFMANQKKFVAKMKALKEKNAAKLTAVKLKQPWLMEYHQEFTYLLQEYGLTSMGSVEEKPGVPPSAGRLARVAIQAKAAGVKALLVADFAPRQTVERFAELSGVTPAMVPTSIRQSGKFQNYEELQNHIIDSLIRAATGEKAAE